MGVMSLFNVLPNDTYYEQDDGVVIILSFVLQILYKFYRYRY